MIKVQLAFNFLCLIKRRPPRSIVKDTLFPYTTFFLSPESTRRRDGLLHDPVRTAARFEDVCRLDRPDCGRRSATGVSPPAGHRAERGGHDVDRKSTRLNSSH